MGGGSVCYRLPMGTLSKWSRTTSTSNRAAWSPMTARATENLGDQATTIDVVKKWLESKDVLGATSYHREIATEERTFVKPGIE
jgi:hypothetical protein